MRILTFTWQENTVDFSGMLIKNNHMQMKISVYFESKVKGGDVCVLTRSKKGLQVCLKI